MSGLNNETGLLCQFQNYAVKPVQVKAYQIKKGDMIEYVTGHIAELTNQHGHIQFSHNVPVALGDYLVTTPEAFVAVHMDKPTFLNCYAPQQTIIDRDAEVAAKAIEAASDYMMEYLGLPKDITSVSTIALKEYAAMLRTKAGAA